jgi:hypothetical protein
MEVTGTPKHVSESERQLAVATMMASPNPASVVLLATSSIEKIAIRVGYYCAQVIFLGRRQYGRVACLTSPPLTR